jgi:hypothetical protein
MRPLPRALEDLQVSTPCLADWSMMRGDDQRRHCERCDKDVVNVAGFTRWEAEQLLLGFRERHCLRILRLPDGTVVTRGLLPAAAKRRRRAFRRALIAGAVGTVMIAIVMLRELTRAAQSPAPLTSPTWLGHEADPRIIYYTGTFGASVVDDEWPECSIPTDVTIGVGK